MLSVKLPNDIRRLPRTIKEIRFWRGGEFRTFLLFLGPVCLRNFLHPDFYDHFMLLSNGIYRLLCDKSKYHNVNCQVASKELFLFSSKTEQLYGKEHCTYNNHQLLHMAKSAYSWGPLWCWSTRHFESFLYDIKSSLHGSQRHCEQLERILMETTILRMESPPSNHSFSLNHFHHVSGAICIGRLQKIPLNDDVLSLNSNFKVVHNFKKCLKGNNLFSSSLHLSIIRRKEIRVSHRSGRVM